MNYQKGWFSREGDKKSARARGHEVDTYEEAHIVGRGEGQMSWGVRRKKG